MAIELIDNINHLLGDSLKRSVQPKMKLKIAASCFSIYAFEALKAELENVESFEFIFTSPAFVPDEVTDAGRKVRREFFIPKAERERGFYGSEFEIQLKNQLTQRAIAKECAEWMRRKPTRRLRDLFAAEIEQIVWRFKLAPETLNIPTGPGVTEIQVFWVELKSGVGDISEDILRCIDNAIGLRLHRRTE